MPPGRQRPRPPPLERRRDWTDLVVAEGADGHRAAPTPGAAVEFVVGPVDDLRLPPAQPPVDIVVVSVYVAGLLSMLILSATYNLWPVSPTKWVLRRFDHSTIYVLIAATYTPFIAALKDTLFSAALLLGVWGVAIFGIVLKLRWPGRFDTLSIGLYLALGWSGIMMYDRVIAVMPTSVLACVLAGGILYSLGVIFHSWRRLRFQNAIWHGFVLLGAGFHYTAVLDLVLT